MKKFKKTRIIALTTDPYDNIYGYSLVFIRLFDYIEKNYNNLEIIFFTNGGSSSKLVNNTSFKILNVNSKYNVFFKTLLLTYKFITSILSYPSDTIIITNCEIPELLAGVILMLKFKNVYAIFQDDRVRNASFFTKLICKIRIFLLYRIKNVFFVNHYTMNNFNASIRKMYIGNPIFF
jgi:hypothetical protein